MYRNVINILCTSPSDVTRILMLDVTKHLGSIKHVTRNLRVTFDSDLTFEEQIKRVLQSCFVQLNHAITTLSIPAFFLYYLTITITIFHNFSAHTCNVLICS